MKKRKTFSHEQKKQEFFLAFSTYSPLIDNSSNRILGLPTPDNESYESLAIPFTCFIIFKKLEATVIKFTGRTISPFSTTNPLACKEKSVVIGFNPACNPFNSSIISKLIYYNFCIGLIINRIDCFILE